MSELFRPISTEQLASWLFGELDSRDSAFGIPREHFFVPRPNHPCRTAVFDQLIDTPFGPAAGPHTQMAQNIIAAWLCGARYIELKTVQTLDELDVSKPCIDMQDEGYNVEWSQELKVHESFDEYLRAWVLIHALHHKLGFPGDSPAVVFNMSVGYDLAGIKQPNMQWFLAQMRDCSIYKDDIVEQVARFYPAVLDLEIPDCISDNVTLSTMHGCPPGEIEKISTYLIQDRLLHTYVKCNPTLLGPGRVRELLNEQLKYTDVEVPDIAFEHDLAFDDAVPIITNLRDVARNSGRAFGVKLSNTLEVRNTRTVFNPAEEMSYLSGRPLHAITVNLADKLAQEFAGELPLSFSAGATRSNTPNLLAAGMQTVTVCSDLLRTGGYLRLLDYVEAVESAMAAAGATSISEFIVNKSGGDTDVRSAAMRNLSDYATRSTTDADNIKSGFDRSHTKTRRPLEAFDCIKAPCTDECPLEQDVPAYMAAVREDKLSEAERIVRRDNPIPCILGRVCDHQCEHVCVRTHIDEPLAIRDIKRFILDANSDHAPRKTSDIATGKVAIIGAGPGGMSAAQELVAAGMHVEIFEEHDYGGGMVGGVVPEYRLPQEVFDRDFAVLEKLGVEVHYNVRVGKDIQLSELRQDGFEYIVIMAGAQRSKTLALSGEECDDVVDALEFLRRSRENRALTIGNRVGIIGAGDSAMDCARVAWRQNSRNVTLIYRRTIDQMPADREEIEQLAAEGVDIIEMAKPDSLIVEGGRLRALQCNRTRYTGDFDASGRKIPQAIPDSYFDVPLDTLIMAISQHAVLDFLEDEPVRINERGYIDVDPETFETSVPGLYAGGDVVNDGPASIVKAAAAGKAIADGILRRTAPAGNRLRRQQDDVPALVRKRGQVQRRIPAPQTDPGSRRNFDEVVLTYGEDEARAEASRCLDCDTYCSLCVGVCPNLALLTYPIQPFSVSLPKLDDDTHAYSNERETFEIAQPSQVAVLTDLCNECGNCTTFCPTSGRPYRDKPRLYTERSEFEAQPDNAFLIEKDGEHWAMEGRWQDETHRIELNGGLDYYAPAFKARLDPDSFDVRQLEATGQPGSSSLEPCAEMYVLLRGLLQSMPYLPLTNSPQPGGRIAQPGYEE